MYFILIPWIRMSVGIRKMNSELNLNLCKPCKIVAPIFCRGLTDKSLFSHGALGAFYAYCFMCTVVLTALQCGRHGKNTKNLPKKVSQCRKRYQSLIHDHGPSNKTGFWEERYSLHFKLGFRAKSFDWINLSANLITSRSNELKPRALSVYKVSSFSLLPFGMNLDIYFPLRFPS